MSKADSRIESQKPKTSKRAITFLVSSASGLFALALTAFFLDSSLYVLEGSIFILALSALIGIATGIGALLKIKYRSWRLAALFLSGTTVSFVLFIWGLGAFSRGVAEALAEARCSMNLYVLGLQMEMYSTDNHGEYPAPDKWCDLLMKNTVHKFEECERIFVCPSAGEGSCHYAINPNCETTSPPDVVLLFESKEGWNQFGGLEILTLENHKGKACYVLFNGGHVEFVRRHQLRKLKWKTKEGNGK